ncbi:hypothetical protein ACJ73_05805 [Blastomyces percursus]|uniref:CCHC-type domain-containing protein n=1 Tax=Blastomyces percursus TaxID=1658174 RepID=A0A1J9R2Y2_9EURO|nr:hypothetical protein ACJ73_05805 [Blastomyces percursus]
MDSLFLDYDAARRAATWLSQAKQGTQSLSEFIAEFDGKLAVAGGLLWDDIIKITFLMSALSMKLKKNMIAMDLPSDYRQFCAKIKQVETRLQALDGFQGSGRRFPYFSSAKQTPAPAPDTMDWIPTSAATRTSFRVPGLHYDDVAERRAKGVCIKCTKPGHIASRCTDAFVPGKRKPFQANATKAKRAAEEDSDDAQSESGKE